MKYDSGVGLLEDTRRVSGEGECEFETITLLKDSDSVLSVCTFCGLITDRSSEDSGTIFDEGRTVVDSLRSCSASSLISGCTSTST